MKTALVIGSGLGGLAAALRLRKMGLNVTVIEKQERPGGRSNVLMENGFRMDTGPTILVMKDTFDETYRALGHDINQRLHFTQLDPNYRIYFHDGDSIDLYSNMARLAAEVDRVEPGSGERLFQFLGANARKYELAMQFVDRNYDHITDLANPVAGVRLLETQAHQRMYAQVSRFFQSDKLRKAFSFHSMFLGLSPFDALSIYSLITYADMARGMFYPTGGIYSIIEDLLALAAEMGVEVRTQAPAAEILIHNERAVGVRAPGEEAGDGSGERAIGVRVCDSVGGVGEAVGVGRVRHADRVAPRDAVWEGVAGVGSVGGVPGAPGG